MSDFPQPPRLTDEDIALFESHLARGNGPIRDFEMLDGFFAALVTGPEFVSPITFLPALLGDPDEDGALPLPNWDETQEFLEQIQNHWNRQVTTFMAGEPWGLWLRDPEGPAAGRRWAEGFLLGVDQEDGWDRLARRLEHGHLFMAVMSLANEESPDPELRPGPISPADRDAMLGSISHGLPKLYAATRPGAVDRPSMRRAGVRKATAAKPKRPGKTRKSPKAPRKPRPRRGPGS